MSQRPPLVVKLVPATSFYGKEKSFDTDYWVGANPGLWRADNNSFLKIEEMESEHLSSTISFIERRDPNYKKSKVWAALVAEYHNRTIKVGRVKAKPASEAPQPENPIKRKFRFKD